MDKLTNLTSIHFAHNQIEEIKNISNNHALDTVDFSGNPVTSLEGNVGIHLIEKYSCCFCYVAFWLRVQFQFIVLKLGRAIQLRMIGPTYSYDELKKINPYAVVNMTLP